MAPNDYDDEVDDEDDDVEESEEEEVAPKKRSKKAPKDPNKPKRAMSAFFLYSQAMRQRVKDENPEASFGEIARTLARKFKELPEKETRKWEKKAEQEKGRYQEEMKHYVPPDDDEDGGGGGGGGKKKKQKKDPNAPKRNMSAYFLFSIAERPHVKEDNPDASFGDIARIISVRFKSLPPKERKIWEDKAIADKERYENEMEAYRG